MNDLNDFVARWNAMEAQWNGKPDAFERLPPGDYPFLNADELRLLQEIGLPQSGPDFSYNEIGKGMPRVDEVYGPKDEVLWAKIGRDSVARYRMIGQDGGGNPLVLDIESHQIKILDHESAFRPFDLINSSLRQFYQSLLVMQRASADAPDVDVEALQRELEAIDPQMTAEEGYWHTLAEDLPDFD